MLEYLRIRNLALIEDMELEFVKGLNVLTGETGAGKSFILKALSFLTGERLGADLVRPGQEKATVEGLFALPGEDLVIRRELSGESGRSRFYINDRLSSQEALRELKPSLILHTSQHEQQRLMQPGFQTKLLEMFCRDPELFSRKDGLAARLKSLNQQRDALTEKARLLSEKRELLEHQQREIAKVAPEENEEEILENKRLALRHQEAASDARDQAMEVLRGGPDYPGLNDQISRLRRSIEALSKVEPDLQDEEEALGQALDTFNALESRLRKLKWGRPGENSEDLEARLYELAQLKRKLKRSLPEILALSEEINDNLSFLDACALDLRQLEKEEEKLAAELYELLQKLNSLKLETAGTLTANLAEELKGLGFSEHLRLEFEFSPQEIYPARGKVPACVEQKGRLLWVPNPGQSPQPLDKIASGGELSRFLLGLVGLTVKQQHNDEQPTLIFDEVDAGVGGITLNRLADRLNELAQSRQILLITHWPRLAAHGQRHFMVQKDVIDGQTFTLCRQLDQIQRQEEISRMAGGGAEGEAMARQLLG